MIEAAEAEGKRIGVQGRRYEGYMVWINALVRSGGGQIIENPELGADATPTVASPAGDKAAEIVGKLARSSAAPADMSTAGEEEASRCSRATTARSWSTGRTSTPPPRRRSRRLARPVGRRRHRLGALPGGGGRQAEHAAARRHQPRDRGLHQVSGRGAGGGEVHHVAREQHRVHDRVGQPGGPGRGLRRPGRTRGVPDGRPDPRVDQRAPGPGPSRRTTATCRCRCNARGTRRRASASRARPEETDDYMAQVLQGERLL